MKELEKKQIKEEELKNVTGGAITFDYDERSGVYVEGRPDAQGNIRVRGKELVVEGSTIELIVPGGLD